MSLGNTVLALCCMLYLLSGGRWSIVIAAGTLSLMYSKNKQSSQVISKSISEDKAVDKESSKPSPIYAVDFTSTSFTPESTTNIPENKSRSVKPISSIRSRGRRSPKIIKANKPITNNSEPALTRSTVNLLDSQIYIFYTTLTG